MEQILTIVGSIILGALGSMLAVYILRLKEHFLEFVPCELSNLSVVASFQPFYSDSPGDTYKHVLWIRIWNTGAHVLYIVRAVYFRDRENRVPIYMNASISQKYKRGYEAKFGKEHFNHHALIEPSQEITTYIPLSEAVADNDIPSRKRGFLLFEYVYDGNTGKHKVIL
jgi:hypothetical protein